MMLLFAAALLGGSVDTVACEPEIEHASLAVANPDGSDHTANGQAGEAGTCAHGHCHPGSPILPPSETRVPAAPQSSAYGSVAPPRLGFLTLDTPDHPPRA